MRPETVRCVRMYSAHSQNRYSTYTSDGFICCTALDLTTIGNRRVSFNVSIVRPSLQDGDLAVSPNGFHTNCGKGLGTPVPKLICPEAISAHPGLLEHQLHNHGFLSAVLFAFNHHLPLTLRPEHFWNLVLQAVARHVNSNTEELRSKFVSFDSKEILVLERDNFVLGSTGNDWSGVVREFGDKIAAKTLKDVKALLSTNFTSTTDTEIIAGKVAVMDAVKGFFAYTVHTLCGFPAISLEGASGDWHALRRKSETLIRHACTKHLSQRWLPALIPVLEKIAVQYDNPASVDVKFWESFCKLGGGLLCGSKRTIDGWVNVFLPTLKEDRVNEFCMPFNPEVDQPTHERKWDDFDEVFYEAPLKTGVEEDCIPCGISSVPAVWKYFGNDIEIAFRAGFVGAVLRPDGSISPDLGWYIMRKETKIDCVHNSSSNPFRIRCQCDACA